MAKSIEEALETGIVLIKFRSLLALMYMKESTHSVINMLILRLQINQEIS